MKSSTGKYYIGLDHLRALAAFMVFSWHFIHTAIPFTYTPSVFPLSLFNEGHTGVALFMTLSGYLFAKLLDGKRIRYGSFLWNRVLRLAPLLLFVLALNSIKYYYRGASVLSICEHYLTGLIKPTLPNGGWSITVEFHFYLLLPILLYLSRASKYALSFVVCCAILIRLIIFQVRGEVQELAYWTIVGRIDQFLLGMIAFQMQSWIKQRHLLVLGSIAAFSLFYWYFDRSGGFYNSPSYPSNRSIWVYFPTLEGLTYGLLIAWYDNSFSHSQSWGSRFIALIGTYSYSIYLLHYFFTGFFIGLLHGYVLPITNFYIAFCFSVTGFLLMVPIGYLSFRFIESPFLKLRTRYLIDEPAGSTLEMKAAEETETLST